MSRAQIYEGVAIDRPLTAVETSQLRAIPSRADIAPSRFFVRYDWGDLSDAHAKLLTQSFDAFLHVGGWGSRWLAFRLPKSGVEVEALAPCFAGGDASLKVVEEHVLLEVRFEPEEHGDVWDDEPSPTLASLVPLRDELLRGDLRFGYLAWLWAVDHGGLGDDVAEPPMPQGLAGRTPAQDAFISAFALDPVLVEVAVSESSLRTAKTLRRLRDERHAELDAQERDEAAASRANEAAVEERRLMTLARDVDGAWEKLEALVAASAYDEAFALATDLERIARTFGEDDAFANRLEAMRARQRRRRGFFSRWNARR